MNNFLKDHARALFVVCVLIIAAQSAYIESISAQCNGWEAIALQESGLITEATNLAHDNTAMLTVLTQQIQSLQAEHTAYRIAEHIQKVNPRVPAQRIAKGIVDAARENGIDPYLWAVVVQQESNYNPYAIGSDGDSGLSQIIPATAAMLGLSRQKIFVIEDNLKAGAEYLAKQIRRTGSVRMGLVRYNGNPAYANVVLARFRRFKATMPPEKF